MNAQRLRFASVQAFHLSTLTFAPLTRDGARADIRKFRFARRRIRPSFNASGSGRVATNTLKIQALGVSLVGELAGAGEQAKALSA